MRLRMLVVVAVLLLMGGSVYGGASLATAELQVSVISGASATSGCSLCTIADPDNLCLNRTGAAPVRFQVVFSNLGTTTSAGIFRYDSSTTTVVTAPAGWTCNPLFNDCTSPGFPGSGGVPGGSSHTFVLDYTPPSTGQFRTDFRGELEGSADDACIGVFAAAAAAGPAVPALDGLGLALLTLAVAAVATMILRGR
jgi:hypothetical protein